MAGPERTLSYGASAPADTSFVAPYVVLVFECERPTAPSARWSIAEVDEVRIGRGIERSHRRETDSGRPVLAIEVPDHWMSSRHAVLARVDGGWEVRDAGSKNGTFCGGERIDRARLEDGAVIEAGSTLLLFRDSVRRDAREPADAEPGSAPAAFTTLSPPLARELATALRMASSEVPIVITGESGTGKEVLARDLHRTSGRRGAFVAINCAALPESLIEGELFGHRKGAFSGATEDRAGLVRAADRGTLFLDEIADLPAGSQGKLLRVLQEREVVPLGETRPISVDVRVIAATHRDLEQCVAAGTFRADLFARLAGHAIELPPLRDRREDLGVIAAALVGRLVPPADLARVKLDREAARAIMTYDWPLNIRELEQALRAALALADDHRITRARLPENVLSGANVDTAIRDRLLRLMEKHAGNVSSVAREMGKARVQIRRWCRRFGIDPADYRE